MSSPNSYIGRRLIRALAAGWLTAVPVKRQSDTPDDAIGYAQHYSRSHDAVINVYDEAGNVIETHELGRRQRIALG